MGYTVCISDACKSFVTFHLLSFCPPPLTLRTLILSNCSPVVQLMRVASHCSSTLLTLEVPQPQPTDSSNCKGGQRRGSLHRHQRTQQNHPSTSRPSESSYGDVCGAVMCEESVCVCSVPLYCKPCHALNTKHIV